ncbi:MAG TPA: transglutaminase-like domain-containing protein [Pseudonocardiaceae bacterium]|nr:transglutaminase-like domain-containing protein [Pseudonocardiaceae bacterium]
MDSYRAHSRFSDPGAAAPWLDTVGPDVADIRAATSGLVFHYQAHGDITDHGFPAERRTEINLRYADDMFARLRELNPAPLGAERAATERIVGCCRDATLLFVALARHHGVPARARVGFATYLLPGWALDHVIAEIWDGERWRLVEPELPTGFVDPGDGVEVDLMDVPREKFLVGADAWARCRSGDGDPDRFTVGPDVPLEFLRGWPYLTHNLVFDLAALNSQELILWDVWGLIAKLEAGPVDRMDTLAELLRTPDVPLTDLAAALAEDDLRIPDTVLCMTPLATPEQVTLRTG